MTPPSERTDFAFAPMISVIIVNWNGKQFLDVCLSSLRDQTFPDFEIIFVDNGSEDGSVDFVRREFSEVRIVALTQNLGFAGGNIAGYREARGEIIVLLNNDTKAHPDWLMHIANAVEQHPEAGSFACKMLYFDEPGKIENCGFNLDLSGATVELGRDELDSAKWTQVRSVFGACGGAAVYRRAMLADVGFLDSDFFLIYEDVDLAFRAQLGGYSCLLLPNAIVYHRYRASIGRHSFTHVYYSQRNIELLYLKNMPLALMLISLPRRFLYEVGAALYFLKAGSIRGFLRAKGHALWLLPSLWRSRRRIAQSRKITVRQLRMLMTATSLSTKWNKLMSQWMTS